MKHKQLLDDLAKLNLDREKNRFQPCGLELSSAQLIENPADLWTRLETFVADCPRPTGWICCQSRVTPFDSKTLRDHGRLRYGEISIGSTNLLIHELDGDRRRLTELTETQNGDYLRESITHLGQCHRDGSGDDFGQSPGDLCYRRYWRFRQELGFHAFAARFIRFTESKKGVSS